MGRVKSLFSWCTSSYSKEIHRYLKLKELSRHKISFQSPQATRRKEMVDWIRRVAEKFKLTVSCVHLAVLILDKFMDSNNIRADCIGTVAVVCLWVAAKYDNCVNVPRIHALVVQGVLTFAHEIELTNVVALERFMLHLLHYRLEWPTTAHFAEYYRLFAVVCGDRDVGNTQHSSLLKIVQLSYDYFLDQSLLFIDLANQKPSCVAAGCLLAARLTNIVTPPWPDSLRNITGCTFDDVRTVANFLMLQPDVYSDQDSGYSSSPDFRLVRATLENSCTSSPTI